MVNRNLKEVKINIVSKAYKTDAKARGSSNSLPYLNSEANLNENSKKAKEKPTEVTNNLHPYKIYPKIPGQILRTTGNPEQYLLNMKKD